MAWLRRFLPTDGRGRERYRRIASAVSMSAVSKVFSVASQMATVGIAAKFLGPMRYGVWVTITAGLAFLSISGMGITPGLVNALSEAHGHDDREEGATYFSTAMVFSFGLALGLSLLFALIYPHVNWGSALNVPSNLEPEARAAVLACFVLFVVGLPLANVPATYNAYQEVHITYSWQIAGSVISVPALIFAVRAQASLPLLIVIYSGSTALINLLNGIWLVARHRPYLRPRLRTATLAALRRLFSTGVGFLLINGGILATNQFVTISIARHLAPTAVAPYEVTMRLILLANGIWAMFTVPLWGAYGEARTRGDWTWIWRTHRVLLASVAGAALLGYAVLAIIGPFFIRHWAGEGSVPPRAVLLLLCAYGVIQAVNMVNGSLLSGLDRVGRQGAIEALNVVLVVGTMWPFMKQFGLAGAPLSLVISAFFSNTWLLWWQVRVARRSTLSARAPSTVELAPLPPPVDAP